MSFPTAMKSFSARITIWSGLRPDLSAGFEGHEKERKKERKKEFGYISK